MTVTVQRKICMLGGFSVGKTSLVKRYVQSIFSESYMATVGVKIDKKTVTLDDRVVHLILWDLAGEDDMSSLRMSYLRGSAGYVLVADGTRPSTLEVAHSLRQRVEADLGPLPFVVLLDVSAERDAARRMQQKAYDMTLAQEREALLNRRLEEANAALLAAQRELEVS